MRIPRRRRRPRRSLRRRRSLPGTWMNNCNQTQKKANAQRERGKSHTAILPYFEIHGKERAPLAKRHALYSERWLVRWKTGFALSLPGCQVGVRDPVVPAEDVLIEKDPAKSHARGHRRQVSRQHAPPAQRATGGSAIEARQFEPGHPQSRSAGSVDDHQVLVGRPKQAGDSHGESQNLQQWRTHRSHLPENVSRTGPSRGDDQVRQPGQPRNAIPAARFAAECRCPGRFSASGCSAGFDGDSTEAREAEAPPQALPEFAGARRDRLGQLIRWRRRRSPGEPRELDDFRAGMCGRLTAPAQRRLCRVAGCGVHLRLAAADGSCLIPSSARAWLEMGSNSASDDPLGVFRARGSVRGVKLQAERRVTGRTHFAPRAITVEPVGEFVAPGGSVRALRQGFGRQI